MYLYQLILIIVSIVLLYNIFNNNQTVDKTRQKSFSKKNVIPTNELKPEPEKKVTFNLKKNTIHKINEKLNDGKKILNNNKEFSINNINQIVNPQDDLINRLNKKKSINTIIGTNNVSNDIIDDIFIDQKSYWDSLNIGDFTERDYLNKQTNDFNIFKNNTSFENIEISKLYDDLTNGKTNAGLLIHDDESIKNSDFHNINGYSSECNKLLLNNIEN